MARPPVVALHQRIADAGAAITDAFEAKGALVQVISGIPAKLDKIDGVAAAISAIGAKLGQLDAIDKRLSALEGQVAVLARRQYHWLFRLMTWGVDPASGQFQPTHALGALLTAAKYPDVKSVAAISAPRGQKPWHKLHQDLDTVYRSDTKKFAPPPDPIDLETFYEICAAL